jgi:hypothetical protein
VLIPRHRGEAVRGGRTVPGVFPIALLLAVALAFLTATPAPADARWRPPLPGGALAGAFDFDPAAPFERGRRRGVDLRGAPGARVLAACGGTVTYAGLVPGWDRGVSLRCGALVATELGLASASVARGARVLPGASIGRLGRHGLLRLGARRVGVRHGYRDPLALLGRDDPARPTLAPRGVPRHRVLPSPVAPVPATPPASAATPAGRTLPMPALAGLALLAAGVGGGGVVQRRHRLRRRTGPAVQPL